ncbi:MAG: hypothetical protein R2706_06465 [Acidimicrobiales bacterium]
MSVRSSLPQCCSASSVAALSGLPRQAGCMDWRSGWPSPLPFAGLGAVIGLRHRWCAALPQRLVRHPRGWGRGVNRQARSEVRATLQSFLGQAGSLGEVAGGLLLGGVAQTTSIPVAFYGSALFFCLSFVVVVKNRPIAVETVAV